MRSSIGEISLTCVSDFRYLNCFCIVAREDVSFARESVNCLHTCRARVSNLTIVIELITTSHRTLNAPARCSSRRLIMLNSCRYSRNERTSFSDLRQMPPSAIRVGISLTLSSIFMCCSICVSSLRLASLCSPLDCNCKRLLFSF